MIALLNGYPCVKQSRRPMFLGKSSALRIKGPGPNFGSIINLLPNEHFQSRDKPKVLRNSQMKQDPVSKEFTVQ